MTESLTIPRHPTWEVLQKSRNLAAVATLSTGLRASQAELRYLSLKALLARNDAAAYRAILSHWESYDLTDVELLQAHKAQFAEIAKSLLATGTLTEKRVALAAITDLDLTDALDEILEIVVDPAHGLAAQATECLAQMCERWGAKARLGKDALTIRGKMLERMFAQLVQFPKHENLDLIDAWLCLVHWDDSLQRGLIADCQHDAYAPVLARLRHSEHPGVIQLLAGYLGRAATPKRVLEILIERPEPSLALAIAKLSDRHSQPAMLRRLHSMEPLRCLATIEYEMPAAEAELEQRLWLMVAASSRDIGQVLRGAVRLSKAGTREARQTAAEMLRVCRRPSLAELVPALQAAEFSAADDQQCLGHLTRQIAAWLSSPSLALSRAARDFFRDFTVENLLDQVRQWPTELCRAMASIVTLVETDAAECLTRELQSPAPRRRLAALQVIQLLSCVDRVSQTLLPLLDDPRLEVRVRTIDLLGALGHEALEQMIPKLLQDASTDIQDAAGRAVRRLERIKRKANRAVAKR